MAKSTDIPLRYATAWLDAAEESGVLDKVRQEIEGLKGLVESSEDLRAFLQDKTLPVPVKQGLVSGIFEGKIEPVTLNFLLLIVAKQRERLLGEMLDSCALLLDERDGIVNADVTSAVALDKDQVSSLVSKLEAYSGKKVRIGTSVDPSLLGGFVASVGDVVFDSSLRVHVQHVRQSLLGR